MNRVPSTTNLKKRWNRSLCLPALWIFATAGMVSQVHCAPERRRPPNLLLIAVDTLRADHLGAYGYGPPTSPKIDEFMKTAVVFEDAHSVAPWTLPSFASLMTGQHVSAHRCWSFNSELAAPFATLAEILSDAGYHTAAIVSHVFLSSDYGLQQGFSDYDESLVFTSTESDRAISSGPITERALEFLDQRSSAAAVSRPWFLWVHYFDPHWQYQKHTDVEADFGIGDQARYDGEIAYTDSHIGDLLSRLEERGFAENTIVAFVADHGEEFGEHGLMKHGKSLYEEVIRVPFAIRAEGMQPRRVADTVSTVDFLPTVLSLLGIAPPSGPSLKLAGRDLVPLMRGEATAPGSAFLESRLQYRKDADLEGWVTDRWKLIIEWPKSKNPHSLKTSEGPIRMLLFDRDSDPRELQDVSAEHRIVTQRLMAALVTARRRAEAVGKQMAAGEPMRSLPEEQLERLRALGYLEGSEVTDAVVR